jgi:hypothetical protein
LLRTFYRRIWNEGHLDATLELLTPEFSFRGSLGNEMHGREEFKNYVRSVRGALADYPHEILSCVAKGKRAFAKMCFSGRHVAAFRGTDGELVQWLGGQRCSGPEHSMIAGCGS